ncbi:MAG: hypothetical protein UF405_02965 [Acutalibacteraceae bacterium]|nr:hypothetical protein [Acutalibacteraceae bacterium]
MLPLLLRQDGKKGSKRNASATEFGTQERQDPGTDFAAPDVQQGIIPIPKSKNPARLAENMPVWILRRRGRIWRRWAVCIKTVVPATIR